MTIWISVTSASHFTRDMSDQKRGKSRFASELINATDRCKFSLGIPRMPVAFTEGERWRGEGSGGREEGDTARRARADTLESKISLGRTTSLIKPSLGDWGRSQSSKVQPPPYPRTPDERELDIEKRLRASPCTISAAKSTLISGLRLGIPFLTKVKKTAAGHATRVTLITRRCAPCTFSSSGSSERANGRASEIVRMENSSGLCLPCGYDK